MVIDLPTLVRRAIQRGFMPAQTDGKIFRSSGEIRYNWLTGQSVARGMTAIDDMTKSEINEMVKYIVVAPMLRAPLADRVASRLARRLRLDLQMQEATVVSVMNRCRA